MKSPYLVFGVLLMLTFSCWIGTSAQDPAPPPPPPPVEKTQPEEPNSSDPCPKISLKVPNQPVRDGLPVRLGASLSGGDKKVIAMFDWSLSAGVIRSGQGTPSIEVDTTGAGADRVIYATLLIGGYPPECTSSETVTVNVAGPPRKADEFGSLPEAEMASRIESFIASVPPTDQVHIFAYAGRTNVRGFASSSLKQIRAQALKSGISADRLVTADGGYRDEAAFELWIVPLGAEPPKASPTVSAKDIVFPKSTPTAKNRP